ncbi:transglycosylase domain-containing protein [Myxococcota bacterium]|nr:transglycosylase domain-containing protein [Myxococcota bacterium]MBU1381491.1 transglycosylase domain-containing protein [Myxococcota bacterium]MBU1497675.1 transglycosylase domain-containing protein [Myxococcota bacterium]
MKIILNYSRHGFTRKLIYYHLFLILLCLAAISFGSLYIFGTYARRVGEIPDFSHLKTIAGRSTRIVAMDHTLLAEISGERRQWANYNQIPPLIRNAFIAVEDARFFEHGAIDTIGLLRAIWTNLKAGQVKQGGSTITQQTAKFYMGGERTLDRKIREIILALRFERHFSKEEILELYLNLTFLGQGSYGVKAAAMTYFGMPLTELSVDQAAMLAGMAQAPTRYSPYRNPEVAKLRRDHVLRAMHRRNFISQSELDKALATQISVVKKEDYYNNISPYFTEHVRQQLIARIGRDAFIRGGFQVETTVSPFVHGEARKNVIEMASWQDKRQGFRGPEITLLPDDFKSFKIKSTEYYKLKSFRDLKPGYPYLVLVHSVSKDGAHIFAGNLEGYIPLREMNWASRYRRTGTTDRKIYKATDALKKGDIVFARFLKKESGIDTPLFQLDQIPRVQSAIYTIDHRTGYVPAMVGGTDFDLTKFNRTVQSCRQPGSTYKPFYYALALADGWKTDKMLSDVPYSIVDPATGKRWRVRNYEYAAEHGAPAAVLNQIQTHKISFEQALVWSRNIPSVTIFQALGANKVKKWIRKFGFTTPIIADRGLALGSSCTRIDELTTGFGVFARNGMELKPVYIRRIKDSSGKIIEDHTVITDPLLTTTERLSRIIARTNIKEVQVLPEKPLKKTSELLRKVVTLGHNDPIRETGVIAAGKTGTASKTMDTWFSGYTSRWAVTCWLGDEKYERPLGDDDAAHLTTSPMFGRFVYDAAIYQPLREIPWQGKNYKPHIAANGKIKKPEFHPPEKKPPVL